MHFRARVTPESYRLTDLPEKKTKDKKKKKKNKHSDRHMHTLREGVFRAELSTAMIRCIQKQLAD